MRGCMSDPLRKSLIQAAARSPSWGSSSGTTETATPAGSPGRGRARPELVGWLPGTPDVRGDVPFAALGPRPREGGRPSRSGRKAAGRPRGGQRGGPEAGSGAGEAGERGLTSADRPGRRAAAAAGAGRGGRQAGAGGERRGRARRRPRAQSTAPAPEAAGRAGGSAPRAAARGGGRAAAAAGAGPRREPGAAGAARGADAAPARGPRRP